MKIASFSGDYRFLSNFYPSIIAYEGRVYPSVEHAFQAAKSLQDGVRELIRTSHSPGEAKRLGRGVPLRPDWDDVKIVIMTDLVRLKFQDTYLKTRLLETGHKELVEGNTWNDTFWGVCKGVGQNNLGKVLMRVREELALEK